MKCEYCSEEMADNMVKCANCNFWIPEINKAQIKYRFWLGLSILSAILAAWRIVAIREIGHILQEPGDMVMIVAAIIIVVVAQVHSSRLYRMRRQG